MKITSSKPSKPVHERITEWKAPTGRTLIPGTEMKVKGQPGKWAFIAYVDHPKDPHVEARKISNRAGARGTGNVRCFDPSLVYEVSNDKGGKGA